MSDIIMPKMGDAMTEGKVIRWYKKTGDSVKKGEPVLEIETDKVNLDLEAEEDGTLGEILVQEGSMADVGSVLATLGDGSGQREAPAKEAPSKEAPAKEAPAKEAPKDAPKKGAKVEKDTAAAAKETRAPEREAAAKPQPVEAKPASAKPAPSEPEPATGERVRSSPLARRIARDLGVELRGVHGSGPNGRIVADDIRKAAQSKPAPGAKDARPAEPRRPLLGKAPAIEAKTIPLTAMRRTIARRLAESIGPIPHFFLTIDLDVTDLLALREQLSEIEDAKLSVNDFVIRAAALSLRHHPNVNASFGDEAIEQHGEIHVGIAVATPEGLITPVIRNADRKPVGEIAAEVRDLAGRARNRKLRPDEYQGSTFTISNLGMFGIDEFTAVINPPNVAILAVGAASRQPTVVGERIRIRDRMKITMSCDHRVVDGAAGAEYLRTLRTYLEQPLRLVV